MGIGGPGNYEGVGWDGLAATLNAITDQALSSAEIAKEQLSGAGFGIAGYDWPAEREPTRQAIDTLGIPALIRFVNDTIIGLLAGANEGWGIAVVSGTSNNCRGRDREGREGRVTGNGPWLGEYGGGTEIVTRALHAVAAAWTQRGPETGLTAAFIELVGASDVTDLLEGIILQRYQLSASAAPAVFQTATAGDRVAREVIEWAGGELGSLAQGVIRQLGFERLDFEVVLIGSLFRVSETLTETMMSTIHQIAPGAKPAPLKAPPVVGGVLLAMEGMEPNTRMARQVLIQSMPKLGPG
jgi:N-acetylglucosamine kinase-like BadF-type ATPase